MSRKRSTDMVISDFFSILTSSSKYVGKTSRHNLRTVRLLSALVCGLAFVSCSSSYNSIESDRASLDGIRETELTADNGINMEPIGREVFTSQEVDGLGLELVQLENGAQLVVNTADADSQYNVIKLEDPARLVLDLPPTRKSRLNRVFEVSQNPLVSRIRLGSHSDKSRVVLDLLGSEDISYQADASGELITLTIADSANMMASPKQEVIEEQIVADNDSLRMNADDAEVDIESVIADEPENVELVANTELRENTPRDGSPRLESVRIDTLGADGNIIVAEMESAGFFTIKRTAPSEFVLTLEGATFNPQEIATVLAPPQSGAIRSVRPVQSENETLLRIFAKPGTNLVANARGNSIIIQPEIVVARNDVRAQAAEFTISEEAAMEPDTAINDDEGIDELDDLGSLLDDASRYTGRKISLDLQDTDIDNALRIIAEVSNLNIIASDDVTGKVTLRLIDVPWDQALDVILKTNGLDKVLEGNVMRIAPIEKLRQEREALKQAKEAEEELEPQVVKYIRISYAKASELRPLVESVLTERGTVTYDERTNQLIIKDIKRGVRNVAELVSRLDLRTPQVLLETQIVEAQRSFFREFGSEVGFSFVQSPETGNATGSNFPNSIELGGSVDNVNGPGIGTSFPGAGDLTGGSAISLLLDSADGARSLDMRLTALERDGRVRIVSRPSVVTTNNQQATIKSVEKIRVKTPAGGLSVATGSGASAAGSGGIATETIEIGITLEVTPQASPDYFVLLDINAKSSTFGSQEVDGIPSEVERSATSSVLVSSGQTFAMGGIYKITDRDTNEGVPFLKDIPFFGHFFRRSGVDNADEELLFFITPRIVEGSFDDAAMKLSS